MRLLPIAAVALAATLAPAAALATSPDRYQITPAEGGFLRLDRASGTTSFCSPSGDGYACRVATDAERRVENETSRIEKRLAAIEDRLARLETSKPTEPLVPPKTASPTEMPTDEQIDRAASFVEKALKRLKEITEKLQEDDPADRQRL